jgi:hypothetical protein
MVSIIPYCLKNEEEEQEEKSGRKKFKNVK